MITKGCLGAGLLRRGNWPIYRLPISYDSVTLNFRGKTGLDEEKVTSNRDIGLYHPIRARTPARTESLLRPGYLSYLVCSDPLTNALDG